MCKQTFLGLAIALTVACLPPPAFPQAAAEYVLTTGGSAASATKAGTSINQATNKLSGSLQKSMEKSTANKTESTTGDAYRKVNSMEENRKKLEQKGQAGGETVHIDSVPEKARVLIDGASVAYTPADLKVPHGKHTIEVTDPTHKTWRKDFTLSRGDKLSFKPELEEKYKSEIVLSIQQ